MIGELILPVIAASLGATLVIVTAIFMVTIVKLQKDKAHMRRPIKSMSVQTSETIKRVTNQEYENIELFDQKASATSAMDIEINENPAYSTVIDM